MFVVIFVFGTRAWSIYGAHGDQINAEYLTIGTGDFHWFSCWSGFIFFKVFDLSISLVDLSGLIRSLILIAFELFQYLVARIALKGVAGPFMTIALDAIFYPAAHLFTVCTVDGTPASMGQTRTGE
tara:strand:+ start:212 stop:589 length:378 start_codon:yes stop_codon:yes gene_type:complete